MDLEKIGATVFILTLCIFLVCMSVLAIAGTREAVLYLMHQRYC